MRRRLYVSDSGPAKPRLLARLAGAGAAFAFAAVAGAAPVEKTPGVDGYGQQARPIVQRYCVRCHSAEKHKGGLNFERFNSLADLRRDVKPWQSAVEMLEAEEMPPEGKPKPSDEERARLLRWIRGFLTDEARARAGDPGLVPTRRLSNAEYDNTIRDLTGVDLRPARQFPADGAGGEGFTNASEALTDVSPALFNKYLLAAKEVSAHAMLLPEGFRFSATSTGRDWTNESLARLRAFYGRFTGDGKIPLEPYVSATLRFRAELKSGALTPAQAAEQARLNGKYFGILWSALSGDDDAGLALREIRKRWRDAGPGDARAVAADIEAWQGRLWQVNRVGSYRADTRQSPVNPVGARQTVRLALQPRPGDRDVTVYLSARDLLSPGSRAQVVWINPRLEAPGKPALALRDYAKFGPAYEYDFARVFGDADRYLAAVAEAGDDDSADRLDSLARRDHLDPALLSRWAKLVPVESPEKRRHADLAAERIVPAEPLAPLVEPFSNASQPAIAGWHAKDADLPALLSNSSGVELHIPGLAAPHRVDVHPSPTRFVAAVWTSPIDGNVRVSGAVAHVHPACGNGVAWWLQHRHGERAGVLAEGALELGKQVELPEKNLAVARGDCLVLAIDAKNGNHSCDLTRIDLTVAEVGGAGRAWDLAGDVADSIRAGNPHPDRLGNADVWRFVDGPSRPVNANGAGGAIVPEGSSLARWRSAASDPGRAREAGELALQVRTLLAGAPPANEKSPDRLLYDRLVIGDGPLLRGLDLSDRAGPTTGPAFGVLGARFGAGANGAAIDPGSLETQAGANVAIRLPAALAQGRELVVDAEPAPGTDAGDAALGLSVSTNPSGPTGEWDGQSPIVALPGGAGSRRVVEGLDAFRRLFPLYVCYPNIIPTDEVVCLRMYYREDEPLCRLFLDDRQARQIDRLWAEHRFLTHWPVAENKYLPLFIGFVTQDQPKELVAYFEAKRPLFAQRADEFNRDWEGAAPRQLEQLLDFASRAYRRPLDDAERQGLLEMYRSLRARGVAHDEAFRTTLARVLIDPAFLFRIERSPAGTKAGPIDDWELATRLSYFLWSSMPDDELRTLAAAGRLHDPAVLDGQVRRMLADDRVRALAIEFGAQWLHVRNFDSSVEKNEKLFPAFDPAIRSAINEETVLFFEDLFQKNRPVRRLLDADYAYLNGPLASYYGIPGVSGPQFREVDGVSKFGRGGILGLASVQATEAGASRTSPVLRGDWVVETLLGEKLPRPPADVPRLPDEEGANRQLTTRQLLERHVQSPACATCHRRMDPFGFAFERYDAIGRQRDKELSGLPIDCSATLPDGTKIDGLPGLRDYLLARKKEVIVRVFCRRLFGYALGRGVALSDQPLIDELAHRLGRDDEPTTDAVIEIVHSPQFQRIRGRDFVEEE